ncbi:hypothetical protein HRH25_01080 [Flavisolibacter sp. BT320]|nr:hypothetical protein [Flavisolibacter longurius]
MQGSFEKKVQEKLDELRLTPSEPVWKAIEKELKPEKRRRFPFWIPFIIVLLGGTTWWLLQNGGEEDTAVSTGITTASGANKETETQAIPEADRIEERKTDQSNTTETSSPKAIITSTDYTNNSKNETGKPNTVLPNQNAEAGSHSGITSMRLLLHGTGKAATEKSSIGQTGNESNVNNTILHDKLPAQPDVLSQPSKENASQTEQQPLVNEPAENTLAADSSTAKTTDSVLLSLPGKIDSAGQKTKVAAAKKGWQKVVTVKGGWSRFSDGILGSNLVQADLSSSPAPGYYNGIAGNPNPAKKGAAFQVGIGLSKDIHPRWNVAIGLQYAYYSTQTKVGTYKTIDTAVMTSDGKIALEGYYSNANLRDFTMCYGFLELPLSIGFKPLSRLPLTLSAGASYGRLLHSNSLQYDRWANIYYSDKASARKNIFAGFASLQFAFINKGSWQFEAGPVVQYHLSGLQKNSSKPKLFFAGLQSSIRF